jgi:hypothetical protein
MVAGIADTHTVLWYLFFDPQLGRAASAFIDAAVAGGDHIGVSAIKPRGDGLSSGPVCLVGRPILAAAAFWAARAG